MAPKRQQPKGQNTAKRPPFPPKKKAAAKKKPGVKVSEHERRAPKKRKATDAKPFPPGNGAPPFTGKGEAKKSQNGRPPFPARTFAPKGRPAPTRSGAINTVLQRMKV